MKLEVGMYVRTKHNGIKQINALYSQAIFTDTFIRIENEQIIKASHNIIDLIEVGDYVNGEYVTNVVNNHSYIGISREFIMIKEKDIKSIVTKEQFESMSYKVGE